MLIYGNPRVQIMGVPDAAAPFWGVVVLAVRWQSTPPWRTTCASRCVDSWQGNKILNSTGKLLDSSPPHQFPLCICQCILGPKPETSSHCPVQIRDSYNGMTPPPFCQVVLSHNFRVSRPVLCPYAMQRQRCKSVPL